MRSNLKKQKKQDNNKTQQQRSSQGRGGDAAVKKTSNPPKDTTSQSGGEKGRWHVAGWPPRARTDPGSCVPRAGVGWGHAGQQKTRRSPTNLMVRPVL
jgi:hypothetical protein